MELDRADVVVVGGGVTGLASAWFLAKAGMDVVVVEKEIVGWEASGRNGGGVAYHRGPDPRGMMGYEETRLWHSLEDDLGYPCEFTLGIIQIALDEEDWQTVQALHGRTNRMGWRTELMDSQAVREAVPIVDPNVFGGLLDPDAAHANPQRTLQAYGWAIQDLGGRIHQHTTASGFVVQGDKVTTVETSRGDIATDFVVDAAGPQTGLVADMVGAFVPIAPARVEMIVTTPVPLMKYGMLVGNGLYGRQTRRGNLAYGGGNPEWVDVDNTTPEKPNTPQIRNISRRLMQMFPGAGDFHILRSWACVVEQTPDYLPVIDVLDSPSNFVIANSSGDGFGLGPVHGKAVSDLVLHGESPLPLEPFRVGRFAGVSRNWREERGWTPGPEQG